MREQGCCKMSERKRKQSVMQKTKLHTLADLKQEDVKSTANLMLTTTMKGYFYFLR